MLEIVWLFAALFYLGIAKDAGPHDQLERRDSGDLCEVTAESGSSAQT